jgi:hypothetical protein
MWFFAYLISCLATAGIAAIWISSVSSSWTWFICTLVFLAGNIYGLAEAYYRYGMRRPANPPRGQND